MHFSKYDQYTDIDECSRGTHDCISETETCRNTVGSYVCDCAENFSRDEDNICQLQCSLDQIPDTKNQVSG